MNATPPVSQIPIASDPAQQSSAASANSVKSGANGQDFAAALGNAGAKSIRKAAGHKPADGGSVGGPLPAPGNLSPPPAPPIAAGSAAALAAATLAATLGLAPTPGAAGGPAAVAAAGAAAGSAVVTAAGTPAGSAAITAASTAAVGAASISVAQAKLGDQSAGGASSGSPIAPPGAQGAMPSGTAATPNSNGAAANGTPAGIAPTAASAAAVTTAAASTAQAGAAAGAAAATGTGAAASTAMAKGAAATTVAAATTPHPDAARPGAGASASSAGKPLTGAAATAAVNAATSGRTGTTDGSTTPSANNGAWTSTDPTAQAVTAAAMSAAATGAVAPDAGFAGAADSPSTPIVDSATPAKGAGGPNGSPVPALAISVARAAAAASAKAAAAPSATTLADTNAADKHASGGSGDALLSGMPGDGMAGAAQLGAGTNGVTDTTPTPTLKVSAGVDTPEFGQGLADRVSWMVDNNLNGAKLQVNPPQLGPIEVRIAVQGNHAQVWLTSHSAVTRDALESSSPKLREMLGAQGFGQVSVDISQRSFQERSAFSQPYQWTPSASTGSSTAAVQSTASSLPRLSSGAVDAYA